MTRRTRRSSGIRDIVTFWSLVVGASLLLAVLAFAAGKYWVGGLIARSAPTVPKVAVKTPDEIAALKSVEDEGMTQPPPKAVVKVEQRQPNDAERSEIEQKYPQDGASLHGATGSDSPDASVGSDAKPLDGDGDGSYSVKAGSYRDPDTAQRHADELTAQGYSTEIVQIEVKGKTYNRVMVGPYTEKAEAERIRDELSAAGYQASVKSR